ncbi:phosphotransferase enzyme family protein [Occultella gossypii]|uniref:Phosphotransferase n=1 Tax=Occultella gossypii TaxID=2800820 RepID=A0ABS7S4C2_9MICO|nr:phosphotransferase [Occultella gossypii]MBZ2195199.1 phosphotransferase [Occultella gossypii]
MFPSGLSMLWERDHAPDALHARFGFTDVDEATGWLTGTLRREWGLSVVDCERVLISDHNAIAWVRTDASRLVVKVGSNASAFERLAAIADVLGDLDAAGLPVAAPLPSIGGARRVVDHTDRPLSVVVQPFVEGDLLDTTDAAAVRAAGTALAHLHEATAGLPTAGVTVNRSVPEPDLRRRLLTGIDTARSERAPRAGARLAQLLVELPDIDTAPQLIHSDYRGTNIVMSGARVAAILDFDEMTVDHRVYDVARAAVNLATRFRSWRPTTPDVRAQFLAGYRSGGVLTDREEGWLEAFILWMGVGSVPPGDDPDGWADAVEHGL